MEGSDCIFCAIIAGKIPSKKVYETETVLVIEDIAPQAPVHLLIIPKEHVRDIRVLSKRQHAIGNQIMATAQLLSTQQDDQPFRLVINTGEQVGQSVFHLHCHYLAGKAMQDL